MTRDSKNLAADDGESVLSRWSRRKAEARQAEAQPAAVEAGAADAAAAPAAVEDEKPVLTDADMPDLDTLTEESDFSPFMSAGVSDELRNLALRKLFRAPVFNIRDGLDEYDDDFTQFEKLGDIVTADMKHRVEMEQQKLREKLAEAEAAGGQGADDGIETSGFDDDADEIEDIDDDEEALVATAENTEINTDSDAKTCVTARRASRRSPSATRSNSNPRA